MVSGETAPYPPLLDVSDSQTPGSRPTDGNDHGPVLIACSDRPEAGAALALGRLLAAGLEASPLGVHVIPHPDYMLGDDAGLMFERRAQRIASRVEEELSPLGGRALTIPSHSVAHHRGHLRHHRPARAGASPHRRSGCLGLRPPGISARRNNTTLAQTSGVRARICTAQV